MNLKVVGRLSSRYGGEMLTRGQSLADQVHKALLNWIQTHQVEQNGGALPSETEFAEIFSTSRATVREALARLERERLVIRRHGAGTFISPSFQKLSNTINELNDPLIMINRQGASAVVDKLEYFLGPVSEDSGRVLEIKPDDMVVHLRLCYLLDGVPTIGLEAIIPVLEFYVDNSSLPAFSRLARFASEVSGWNATHSIANIQAATADEPITSLLQIPVGHPVMVMKEVYFTDLGQPAFQSTLYILSNKVELDLLRNSDQSMNQIVIW
jgi:GntR family transcriptional regulator